MIKQHLPPEVESRDDEHEERRGPPPEGPVSNAEMAARARAARGVAGRGGPLPHREAIQASFGAHDVSGVRAHVGGPAAEASAAIGAEAYATGDDVAFAREPSLHMAAHEAAHVVQQRGGVQLYGGVGHAGDAHEQHADAVADRVVRGQSAEALLDERADATAATSARAAAPVQKWGAKEHADLGNQGSGNRTIELASDYHIPFGEVTALADHFANLAQMRKFAANKSGGACSRAEIEYAREWKGFLAKGKGKWDEKAKKAQTQRYFTLAGKNVSHFLNSQEGDAQKKPADRAGDAKGYLKAKYNTAPKGGSQAYRMNHVWAIKEAVEQGKQGGSLDAAMGFEAFGAHFLTDAFSAGHVRTERLSIKAYWDALVPMFPFNMQHYIATNVARELGILQKVVIPTDATLRRDFPFGQGAMAQVGELLKGKRFTFGDVVSLALHDYENEHGIEANILGMSVHLLGDGRLDEKGNESKPWAIAAVKMGVRDIERAFALGKAGKDVEEVLDTLLVGDLFAPERWLPVAKPDKEQAATGKSIKWKYKTVEEILAAKSFEAAVRVFMKEQYEVLKKEGEKLGGEKADAFKKGVLNDVKSKPLEVLKAIVHYVPTDSKNPKWEAENAAAYYQRANKTDKGGGAKSLTYQQRYKLVAKLINHSYSTHELFGVLDTAPEGDAIALITAVGYDRLNEKISEGGKFSTFTRRFPPSKYKLR